MDSGGDWCLIESDPGVFTQLIKKFGVKGVQVEELWTIDESIFKNLGPVHGLIFLFKYLQHEEPSGLVVEDDRLDRIYFAKQVINNACATQAVISILLNCNHPDIDVGSELSKLKEFSMSFDPKMRGLALSNSQMIRSAHNSMAQQTLFEFDPKTASKEDDAYHFIGYMAIEGRVYELDGLRDGPIDHGPVLPDHNWLDVVRPIIMKRIGMVRSPLASVSGTGKHKFTLKQLARIMRKMTRGKSSGHDSVKAMEELRYTEGEIHFNLMAVVSDRKMVYERQLDEMLNESPLMGLGNEDIENEIPRLRMLIEYEDIKMARYRQEMIRRRHNYMPFIIMLLKILAQEKKLMPLYEKAKERAAKKGPKKMKV